MICIPVWLFVFIVVPLTVSVVLQTVTVWERRQR